MKRIVISLLAVVILAVTQTGCTTHQHVIGSGAKTTTSVQEKQWYILFGLVPLNKVDTKAMAAGATDYAIQTQQSFIDGVITFFTSIVTISVRTVEVTK
jgi:hypothetical protein